MEDVRSVNFTKLAYVLFLNTFHYYTILHELSLNIYLQRKPTLARTDLNFEMLSTRFPHVSSLVLFNLCNIRYSKRLYYI